MELYGRNNTSRNGSQSGHQPQWSPTDQATGLEGLFVYSSIDSTRISFAVLGYAFV